MAASVNHITLFAALMSAALAVVAALIVLLSGLGRRRRGEGLDHPVLWTAVVIAVMACSVGVFASMDAMAS